ncbi:MAG: hypothetical protein AB7G47_20325 [Mycolicibacterium sp.]|uniref:DUF7280 family protein n=1 Tax=Mycolicibacterium sp. TaxID=2320850 RepID=UPI003D0FB819
MSTTASIITNDQTVHIHTPIDSLLEVMFEAQNRVGQITWHNLAPNRAEGTYSTSPGTEFPITVTDNQN